MLIIVLPLHFSEIDIKATDKDTDKINRTIIKHNYNVSNMLLSCLKEKAVLLFLFYSLEMIPNIIDIFDDSLKLLLTT